MAENTRLKELQNDDLRD